MLLASPDVIILADIAKVAEVDDVTDWIEEGGLLVRFAGPHLAASDVGRDTLDPLLPVRLRVGGRAVGGTMSWGEPKALAPFPETSPFAGLVAPADVAITAQVLAQPGPDLAEATVATLADGTPLVTRRQIGDGQVVLFHVSANAEWTNLPLSGLFVQMLERLAISSRAARLEEADLAGTTWVAEKVLDGFGALGEAADLPGVPGERLAEGRTGPDLPPGLYASGDRLLAVNVIAPDRVLAAADWPVGVAVEGLAVAREVPLKGWLLGAALALLMADLIASMALAGRLGGSRAGIAVALLALLPAFSPGDLRAQEALDEKVVKAAANVVLAHVLTGDART
ncbi:MAG: LytTR family transcriptional regulator, partial [Rhodobacteraceae bacterium]|nr:LytTR family transcriptional regulator [Paracoccaceae bacterium]